MSIPHLVSSALLASNAIIRLTNSPEIYKYPRFANQLLNFYKNSIAGKLSLPMFLPKVRGREFNGHAKR